MIDKPDALKITTDEHPARVDWFVSIDIDDQGKVIGKKGIHVKALQFLIGLFGLKYGQQFRLTVHDPIPGHRSKDNPPRTADSYDSGQAEALLYDLLDELLSNDGTVIEITRGKDGGRMSFEFRIDASTEADYVRLVHVCDPIGRGDSQTVVAALGTLFRAYALRDGVNFTVRVPSR